MKNYRQYLSHGNNGSWYIIDNGMPCANGSLKECLKAAKEFKIQLPNDMWSARLGKFIAMKPEGEKEKEFYNLFHAKERDSRELYLLCDNLSTAELNAEFWRAYDYMNEIHNIPPIDSMEYIYYHFLHIQTQNR